LSSETAAPSDASVSRESRWGVFGNLAFTVILVASAVSNVGVAMFDTASSWLMTSLNPDPVMVSAVQAVATLPMFLLALPAGALADIVDPRRLLIGAQAAVAIVSVVFAGLAAVKLVSVNILLLTTFVLCSWGALAAPAWLLTAPMLVSRQDLDSAVAINNAAFNVSRAVGPALAGLAIAVIGINLPFWCYCFGNVAVVAALIWWRPPRKPRATLPAERLFNAVRTGLRYARNNRDLRATMMRAIAFFPFASAYLALLPLIARKQMHHGAEVYGLMFGMIGLGSILGSYALRGLKERLGPDRLAAVATIGVVLALLGFAASRDLPLALAASLMAGASWIVMITCLFVSAQVALPDWVRGRGLAIFLTVYFGAMSVGSLFWGKIASLAGVSHALYFAGAGALAALFLTMRFKLQTGASRDLTPSVHWRTPIFVRTIDDDQGPILVTVDYRIDPKDSAPVLALIREIGLERKRDGAYAWNVFENTEDAGRIVETFLIETLLELKYLRARVTKADRIIEDKARAFLKEPPKATFLVAPKRIRHARRKRAFLSASSLRLEPSAVSRIETSISS
jgi:predicted MFS family arabinose efflux permease